MRRLTTHKLQEEDGATAVVVALSLVALFGFAAFAVDVGQLYQERRELQNGADAAVLAAAQDCADPATAGDCVPTGVVGDCLVTPGLKSRIDEYANANANDGESSACVVAVDLNEGSITVETETLAGGAGYLTHWFAGVIGNPTSTVTARATAKWAAFGGGATLPITFSTCEWEDLVGDIDDETGVPIDPELDLMSGVSGTIVLHTDTTTADACGGPANQDSPGGFGWLYPEDGECRAYVDGIGNVDGETGNDLPSECSDPDFLESLLTRTVKIPIFKNVKEQGSNTVYEIIGFAAFDIDGYRFPGNKFDYSRPVDSPPCSPPTVCVSGQFTDYTALGDEPSSGGGNFGVTAVFLAE